MSANIHGKMVYSFEKPMWHNITPPSTEEKSAEAILDTRFGGGFEIILRPVSVELNKKQVETGDFAIIRGVSPYDNQEIVLDYCTERYRPLQPRDVAISFDHNVCEPAETMAFLGKGEDMFISWQMPSFDVVVGDSVDMYGIVRVGFDTKRGARLFTSIYRPVCSNTIALAEGWARRNADRKENRGLIWKGKGVNKNLLRDLGYWMEHVQGKALGEATLLQNLFGKLAEKPIKNDEEAWKLLFKAYPDKDDVSEYYPAQLKDSKHIQIVDYNSKQDDLRQGIFDLFAGEGTAITPNYWGMLCATSEYFCHVQPSKRPIATSVMFGPRQRNTMAMVKALASVK